MSGVEVAILLLLEAICGVAGAMVVTRLWRRTDPGWKSIAGIGAIGGLVLTFLAAEIPGLARFVSHVENTADAMSRSMGGLTPELVIGVGIAGLLGGIISIGIFGLVWRVNSPRE